MLVGAVAVATLAAAFSTMPGSGAVVGAADGPRPAADPATVPGWDADPWSLLGPTRVDASVLADFVRSRAPRTTVSIDELARIYVEEGAALGVRADLAWAQSIVETGSFHFPDRGMVHPPDNNFAGIGACDSCHRGHGYPTARAGVRAQMELLRGYADPNRLPDASIHPPRSYLGIAPTWWQMGNGRWATAPNYASAVTSTYRRIVAFAQGEPLPAGSNIRAVAGPQMRARRLATASRIAAPAPPQPHAGDGLFLLDPTGQVYDVGDARFWGAPIGTLGPSRAIAIATTPHALGYWVVASDGSVSPFGSAPDFGPAPGDTVAVAPLASGVGYFTTNRSGAVAAFGAARLPTTAVTPRRVSPHIVAIAASRTGAGYWLLDADGTLTAAGDAGDFGTASDSALHATPADPAVGLAMTPWGDGGWIVTASGRVAAFGAAHDHGGLADALGAGASEHLVVAIIAAPSGDAYWLVSADGLVVGRGGAPDFPKVPTNGVPVLAATGRLDAAPATRPGATVRR